MIDHIGFAVADLGRSRAFYDATLAPLGIAMQFEVTVEMSGADAHLGYGTAERTFFWIGTGKPVNGGVHIAFTASDRAAVDAFYAAALAAGGRDNGGPGLRPHYHETYYAAFVIDPDGHNIEAVCHSAP